MRRRPLLVSTMHRSRAGTGPALLGSVVLHAVLGGTLLLEPMVRRPVTPPVYRVELVAAPRPVPQQRRAPEAVQRPAQEAAPVRRQPRRRTSVAEVPPPPIVRPEDREPAPRTTAIDSLPPDVEPSTGTDDATVKTSGVVFPYPEYLRNIVAQVYRRWLRPEGNVSLRAEVLFFIHRDGSVTNFRFVSRSGNFGFDLEAQGAIEAAANARAFGPLPTGYPGDVLPVSFFFHPSSR